MYIYSIVSAIILLLATNLAAGGPLGSCTDEQFTCKDGGCIGIKSKCDGFMDCQDSSDETFVACYNNTCGLDQFRCNYGGCVSKMFKCDGDIECWDESDENKYTCANETTNIYRQLIGDCKPPYAMQCEHKCIKWSQVCNSQIDCPNGEDEEIQLCSTSNCPANAFRCANGACISLNSFCDHKIDCTDYSDELPELCNPETMQTKPSESEKTKLTKWKTNTCQLKPQDGMHVEDYFSSVTYKSNALVPDRTVVSIVCDTGYENFGSNINLCENNEWTNFWENCQRVCNQMPVVRYISYTTQCIFNEDLVDCTQNTQSLDTKLLVTCAAGYTNVNDNSHIGRHSCNENGTWTTRDANPSCVPICGIKSRHHPDLTPWTVSIFGRSPNDDPIFDFRCMGTIVSPYIVITAEECFENFLGKTENIHLHYTIAEGNHTVSFSVNEDHGYILHNITDLHNVTGHIRQNMAILRLVKPFIFGATVRPICLDTKHIKKDDEIKTEGVFNSNQLGEGLGVNNNGIYSLTHFVVSDKIKYNVNGFITPIVNDIAKSERNF